jgi:tripartite-type tricarboxylate transporter receptor subunit TctC
MAGVRHTLGLLCVAFACGAVQAQPYPNRPIRLVVGLAPGGTQDFIARTVSRPLAAALGQNVVVDNRDGAAGIIAADLVAKASPDGYTLLHTASAIVINPSIYKKLPFDVFRDFAPVSIVASGVGYLLVVNPTVSAKSLKEFIAQARDGKLAYGSAGIGNNTHLAGEFFNMRTGAKLLHVPYKGGAPALNGLIAGEVQAMFIPPTATVVQHLKTARIRAVAFTGITRWAHLPDVPTVAEAAVPKFQVSGTWHGWLAPANTPKAIIARLQTETQKALQIVGVRDALIAGGYQPVGSSADDMARTLRAEFSEFAEIVRAAKIKLE